jgi:hypothetical protein
MCRHVHSEPSATSQLPVDRPVSSPEVAFSFLRSSSAPDLLVLLGIVHQLPSMRVEFCQFFGFTLFHVSNRNRSVVWSEQVYELVSGVIGSVVGIVEQDHMLTFHEINPLILDSPTHI